MQQVLLGERLSLVPFELDHISGQYIEWLNDPDVNQYLEVRFSLPQTQDSVLEYVSAFQADSKEQEKYLWGIWLKETGGLIGTINLSQINRRHKWASVGFMIGEKSFWGQGLGTEAVASVAKFVFQDLGLNRLAASTMGPNDRSNGIFKKLGFSLEGTLRQSQYVGSNQYSDAHSWGLLAGEWKVAHADTNQS